MNWCFKTTSRAMMMCVLYMVMVVSPTAAVNETTLTAAPTPSSSKDAVQDNPTDMFTLDLTSYQHYAERRGHGNSTLNGSLFQFTTITAPKRRQRMPSRRYPKIPNQELLDTLDRIVIPVALCLGIIGNILIFPTFVYSPLKANPLSHYLAAVSVSDFIHVVSCLVFVSEKQGLTIYHTIGVCQLTKFFQKISIFLTTWYLFAAHLQRFMVHFQSVCTRAWCTTFRSKFIIIFIFVFSVVGYLHYIWTSVLNEVNGQTRCAMMEESVRHLLQLWKIEVIAAVFLPMLLMLSIDVTLLVHSVATRYKLYLRVPSKNGSVKSDCGQDELGEYVLASRRKSGGHPNRQGGGGGRDGASSPLPPEFDLNRDRKSATLVVVISGIIFIALLLPSSVNNTKLLFFPKMPSPTEMSLMSLFEQIVRFNGVYKFVLYFVLMKPFRKGLVYLFKCQGKKKTDENNLQETTEV